ncbi:MAG: DUF4269 domain-containing protein [Cohnella sp.]|uniref:DUF4269 domain-containing protein n=1 Tax=Cohnella sp. TaxID=1883426 RepID=UPI000E396618|nr:DUF4269 domain-containing protein [Cohnella sp.]REK61933.1 MAG: DUF4269 domain-containing protein [Cohnella sp.]
MNDNHFLNIDYLSRGTQTQVQVYGILKRLRLMDLLKEYNPILVGTVPLDLDVPGSDLDIICEVREFDPFERLITRSFGKEEEFLFTRRRVQEIERIKANFNYKGWPIEIFGQAIATIEQNGFKHMVIEARLIELFGIRFKDTIKKLKAEGIKTEPAFAQVLRLEGDPYEKLLEIYDWSDEELRRLWADSTGVV